MRRLAREREREREEELRRVSSNHINEPSSTPFQPHGKPLRASTLKPVEEFYGASSMLAKTLACSN